MQEIQRETSSPSEAPMTISEVVDFAIAEHDEDCLRGNSDPHEGSHTQVWAFTRAVRSCYSAEADPAEVFFDIQREIKRRGGWEILDTYLNDDDIYFEFVCNWDAVRYRIGQTPLGNAVAQALAHPLAPKRASRHLEFLAGYSLFVSTAGWLQVAMGNRPILLPVEKLGAILGRAPMTITRYRQTAIRDGYLKIVQEHAHGQGRATEFFFDVTRFKVLEGKAQSGTEESFEAGKQMV